MNIVVLVKQVPDTYSERKLNASDGILDREAISALAVKRTRGGKS